MGTGQAEGEVRVEKGVGHGMILVLFCYLIINLSQFFAWFGWKNNGELHLTMCPVNLSSYLFYESISSALYFILSTGIIAAAMIMSGGLNGRVATFFMAVAIISGIMRMLWNSMACYWIDTYPDNCRNSPIYKMALASVILFFTINVPVVIFHGRLMLEKFIAFLSARFAVAQAFKAEVGINLKGLLNNPKYSDVEFLVDGVVFYGHKAILSSRSDYFSKLLYGGMKESTQIGQIQIQDLSSGAFLQILEFIYTGEISGLDIDKLEELLELMRCVDLLSFNQLKDYLEAWLKPKITSQNVIVILFNSHKYNYNTKRFAIEKLPKLKSKLKEKDAHILKGEPDLYNAVVDIYVDNK